MSAEQPPTDLEWIQLRKEMDQHDIKEETALNKFYRKFAENPFVPIGSLATVGALSYGLWCFRNGQRKMSQNMMRMRIVAQGLTIIALVTGVVMTAEKKLKSNSSL